MTASGFSSGQLICFLVKVLYRPRRGKTEIRRKSEIRIPEFQRLQVCAVKTVGRIPLLPPKGGVPNAAGTTDSAGSRPRGRQVYSHPLPGVRFWISSFLIKLEPTHV